MTVKAPAIIHRVPGYDPTVGTKKKKQIGDKWIEKQGLRPPIPTKRS